MTQGATALRWEMLLVACGRLPGVRDRMAKQIGRFGLRIVEIAGGGEEGRESQRVEVGDLVLCHDTNTILATAALWRGETEGISGYTPANTENEVQGE